MQSSRRQFLKALGITGSVTVAGCSTQTADQQTNDTAGGGGGGGGDTEADQTETASSDTGTNQSETASSDTGTNQSETASSNASANQSEAQSGGSGSDNTIKIGFLHPVSGGYSTLGQPQRRGGELAIKMLNERGDLDTTFEGFYADTAGEPSNAVQNARELVQSENIDLLTGGANSAAALAIQDYVPESGIVFGNQAGADPITKSRCNRFTFRYELRTGQVAQAVASWAVENLGTKIWFHVADYAYGNAFLSAWKNVLQKSDTDYEIVNTTKSELGSSDFSSYITSMQNSDADFVAAGLAGGDLIKFNQQASSYNLRSSLDLVAGTNDFLSSRKGVGSGVVGTYTGVRYFEGNDNELNKSFLTSYIDEFDEIPNNHAESQWTMVHEIFAPAIEEAGSANPDDLIPVLEGMSFDSPMGGGTLRACDHQAKRPVSTARISEPQDLEVLQGNGGDVPSLEILGTTNPDEAIVACNETGCQL